MVSVREGERVTCDGAWRGSVVVVVPVSGTMTVYLSGTDRASDLGAGDPEHVSSCQGRRALSGWARERAPSAAW